MDLGDRTASRRAIVATGAKLAYAAPLVAASFKLSAVNAVAGTSPTCVVPQDNDCSGELNQCFLACSAENTLECVNAAFVAFEPCETNDDCVFGNEECRPILDGVPDKFCVAAQCDRTSDCPNSFRTVCIGGTGTGKNGVCHEDC